MFVAPFCMKAHAFMSLIRSIAFFLVLSLVATSHAYAGQATLAWDASPAAAVAGYMVYFGQASGAHTSKVDAGKQTTYVVPNLLAGTKYYYAVTAYDASRTESGFSNEASGTVPSVAPIANFSANSTTGTAPLGVLFTSTSSGSITGYSWNFGDGTTSSAQNPSHSYAAAGAYSVSLSVSGAGGSNTVNKAGYITVSAPVATVLNAPIAKFTSDKTSGPAPLTVNFSSTSTGNITGYLWAFSDSTTSVLQNPTHTFTKPGTYNVNLKVTNATGSNFIKKYGYITVSAPVPTSGPPVASFTVDKTSGAAPLGVSFTSSSTGSITSYAWSFGDGATSTLANPTHAYSAAGAYTVILKVTGATGSNSVTKTGYIVVSTAPPTGAGAPPVAAYGFNEGIGSALVDLSGNGNNGVISNATWSNSGRFGKALSFNGTNSWVTIQDAPSLDLTTGMTLEAWVYPTATLTPWAVVLMKEQPGQQDYTLTASSDRAQQPASIIYSGSAERIIPAGTSIPINAWTHLTATYDGTMQRLYINGAQVAAQAQTGPIATSGNPLRIGGDSIWGEYFHGLIDEIRIYNRALSPAEVQTDMNTPVTTAK